MKRFSVYGFTMVEMAIVLVAVGLLLGGVLKGQELITTAKMKRILSDNAAVSVAIFTYQDRYLQIPGDDSNAENRFDAYAPGDPVNGDGNGRIDGPWNVPGTGDITLALTAETNMFFAHLRAAGLITGNSVDDTRPTNAYGGQIGIRSGALGLSGHVVIFGQIEGGISRIIESKMDDGDPASGKIQSGISTGAVPVDMNTALTGSATYDTAERYNMAFSL